MTSCCPVIVEKPTAFIQPLLFEMLGNFRFFCIFQPSLINDWSELINYMFQFDDIHDIWCVQCFKVWNNVIDKCSFLLTFRDYGEFQCLDNLFKIGILIERGAWSEDKWESGRIEWQSSSNDPYQRNMRSITELDSPAMLEYLVGQGLVREDRTRSKESAIIIKSLLIEE